MLDSGLEPAFITTWSSSLVKTSEKISILRTPVEVLRSSIAEENSLRTKPVLARVWPCLTYQSRPVVSLTANL